MARLITSRLIARPARQSDKKRREQAQRLIGRVQRNILLERWEPASRWMLRLAQWIDRQFGWKGLP